MSPTLDTALTIAGFLVVLAGVAAVVIIAPFAMMMGDSIGEGSPAIQSYLVVAAVALPPVVVVAEYVTGVVWAWRASGLTAYYPWVTLAVGAASWFTVAGITSTWFNNTALRGRPHRRDLVKPYAVADTIHCLTADHIFTELDGKMFDDRIGRPDRVSLTPHKTSRRRRAITEEMFNRDYHSYIAHAEKGLPPDWKIEKSEVPPWLGLPGGGTQYVFIAPDGEAASFQKLIERGFLEEIHQR